MCSDNKLNTYENHKQFNGIISLLAFGGTSIRLLISEYQQRTEADSSVVILTMNLGQTGIVAFVTIQFDIRIRKCILNSDKSFHEIGDEISIGEDNDFQAIQHFDHHLK